MPSGFALVMVILGMSVEVCFLAASLYRRSFFRYFFLNFYVLLSFLADALRQYVLYIHGYDSDEYRYTYFYTDCLLTIALFVAVISLASRVFSELRFEKYVHVLAVLLLLGTAGFSYAVVAQSSDRLSTAFAFQLSQNLYFVGLVLTYILWGAILKLQETRTRVVQSVLALGLYFSGYAASYALANLAPQYFLVQYLAPILGCFLPISWALTIWRHDEDARLVPTRLVVVPR